jgi:hypothetical protein
VVYEVGALAQCERQAGLDFVSMRRDHARLEAVQFRNGQVGKKKLGTIWSGHRDLITLRGCRANGSNPLHAPAAWQSLANHEV